MKETLLMGFRYIEGPDPALFEKRFGMSVEAAIPQTMAKWRAKGLLRRDAAALTGEGLLFLNAFLVEAFGEVSPAL
jgi:oxygen-independent coproporphyrinogen-3 oxidase